MDDFTELLSFLDNLLKPYTSTIESYYELLHKLNPINELGYLNSIDFDNLFIIGDLWKYFKCDSSNSRETESPSFESLKRIILNKLYNLILYYLIYKILSIDSFINEDQLFDYKNLFEYIRQRIEPLSRRFLRGSNVQLHEIIYAGFDTEYGEIDYRKVKLWCSQLAATSTLRIRLTNCPDNTFDFSKTLNEDGTILLVLKWKF
jgi:hypothetical protein